LNFVLCAWFFVRLLTVKLNSTTEQANKVLSTKY
jgi:hypothetical protein